MRIMGGGAAIAMLLPHGLFAAWKQPTLGGLLVVFYDESAFLVDCISDFMMIHFHI